MLRQFKGDMTLVGCDAMPIKLGGSSTPATGAAGRATAQNANAALEKCDKPVGTMAVIEDTAQPWYGILTSQYQLPSTVPLLRLLVQQSNCFVVVDRGRAMDNMRQERALQESGELRDKSNFGKGQMVAADYSMTPTITFSEGNTGGVGGAIIGILSPIAGAVAGGMKTREAATLLTLTDNRSGVQVAAAEGSASKTDFSLFGGLFGGAGAAGLGGYTKTPQGKVIAGAFLDSYRSLVQAVKNYKPQEATGPNGMGTGGSLEVK
jgi:curli biogenesis system outer membrane secretion channel CsgG